MWNALVGIGTTALAVATYISLWYLRRQIRTHLHIEGPKLRIGFEVINTQFLQFFSNEGEETLTGEIRVYFEPEDEKHKDKWIFNPNKFPEKKQAYDKLEKKIYAEKWKLRLFPRQTKKHSFEIRAALALQSMGYHQYTPYQTAFEGWYKSEFPKDAPKEQVLELYRILWSPKKWIIISQNETVEWNYNEIKVRQNISGDLTLENSNAFVKKHFKSQG